MAQKIQFIVTVIHKPDLLIFDEPFTGFDPINTNLIKNEIKELNKNGATVIFSTHRMESVEEICDHIALINESSKVLEGTVRDIKNDFKNNTFKIALSNGSENIKLSNQFEILHVKPNHGILEYTVQVKESFGPNDLLKEMTSHGDVYHFEEMVPTVNDIFIQTVEQSSKK